MKIDFIKKSQGILEKKLREAKKKSKVKEITRITALLMLAYEITLETVAKILGVTERTVYNWFNDFCYNGVNSLQSKKQKGCESKLTHEEKVEIKNLILLGPEHSGFTRATWTSTMVKKLIENNYGVSYNRHYVCELLKQMGLSYQKGKFIYEHCDCQARTEWKNIVWPQLLQSAKQKNAVILFEDESSFSQWGSLGYTWATKGEQPTVRTGGRRKSLKVFGAVEYFSGRFVFQAEEHKLNSQSYISFLKRLLERFSEKIILIHDGAPYHKSKAVKDFIANEERLEVVLLPSYSPDFNLIECLWKRVKSRVHNTYFPDFSALKRCVHYALRYVQRDPSRTLELCSSYESIAGIIPRNVA